MIFIFKMPKRLVTINKTNQARINKWIKHFANDRLTNDITEFERFFNDLILDEVKNHKECTEKSVVGCYIDAFTDYINDNDVKTYDYDEMTPAVIMKARKSLVVKYTTNHIFNNNIDIYFNEVKREYILHPMNESDSLEFVPENRDIFIKNNLKLVVNCAKRYRGLGLPFEDLIQTGNYGLLVAFEKFDKDRANLRTAIINNIDKSKKNKFTFNDASKIVSKSFTYDKDLERTLKLIPKEGFSTADEFKNWTKTNVKTAVFASVAFQWIKAYILMELTKLSSTVKIPKSGKKKDEEDYDDEMTLGMNDGPSGPSVVSLDSVNPHTNDNYHDNQMSGAAAEAFAIEDALIDSQDNEKLFHDIIYKAIASLSDINRRIIKKRFGIGYPCPLNVSDIADSEGLATNRVKYIISSCLVELGKNISKKDKNVLMEIFGSIVKDDDE